MRFEQGEKAQCFNCGNLTSAMWAGSIVAGSVAVSRVVLPLADARLCTAAE